MFAHKLHRALPSIMRTCVRWISPVRRYQPWWHLDDRPIPASFRFVASYKQVYSREVLLDANNCRLAIRSGQHPANIFETRLQNKTLSRPVATVCLQEADDANYIDAKLGEAALN